MEMESPRATYAGSPDRQRERPEPRELALDEGAGRRAVRGQQREGRTRMERAQVPSSPLGEVLVAVGEEEAGPAPPGPSRVVVDGDGVAEGHVRGIPRSEARAPGAGGAGSGRGCGSSRRPWPEARRSYPDGACAGPVLATRGSPRRGWRRGGWPRPARALPSSRRWRWSRRGPRTRDP